MHDVARASWVSYTIPSPNGRSVAVSTWDRASYGWGLWTVNIDGGEENFVARGKFVPWGWSRGGEWIYARGDAPAERHIVYRIPAMGGAPEVWRELGASDVHWSCDVYNEDGFVCLKTTWLPDVWIADGAL